MAFEPTWESSECVHTTSWRRSDIFNKSDEITNLFVSIQHFPKTALFSREAIVNYTSWH
jgi:hypothetical protein